MDKHSDLVLASKLTTRFESGFTVHSYRHVPINSERRVVVQREEYWRQEQHIGSGAYGSVWLEKCVQGHQDVDLRAVKKVSTRPLNSGKRIDYSQELKAVAKFSHNEYVHCFIKSFGWYEGEETLFIAMEYLPHGDLQQYLSSMPPLLEEAAGVVIYQILEGLSYMHENRFAHRDLKPGNILIKSCPPQQWWVKIGDFGISKRLEDEGTANSTLLKGTLGFIAPELHELVSVGTSFAADMWALGEIAFQLMTKHPVFKSFGLLAKYATQNHQFPLETLLTYRISTPGQSFISSLMIATPGMRLTAEAALKHQWIARYWPLAVQPSPSSQMTGTLSTTDSITEVFASWNSISISESPPPDLAKTLRPKRSGNYQPIGGSPDPRLTKQDQAGTERAPDASAKSQVSTRHPLQPEYAAPSTHTSTRPAPRPAVATAPLPHHPPIDTAVRSTSGTKMPPPSRSGRDVPRSVSGPQPHHNMRPSSPRDVPGQVAPTKKLTYHKRYLGSHNYAVACVVFSRDGATIASGSWDRTVRIWDAGTGEGLRVLRGHTDVVKCVAFSPDGATIASGSWDRTVRIWDVGTEQALQILKRHNDVVASVAFSPNGATLASGSGDRDKTVRIWNVGTWRELRKLRGHTACVRGLAFSPDGATIASGASGGEVRIWDASTGRWLRKLADPDRRLSHGASSMAFSPDGATIVCGSHTSGTVHVYDVGTGRKLRELGDGQSGRPISGVISVAVSPDGATVASTAWDGSLRIWDASTGQELQCLYGISSFTVTSVAFSRDAFTIASGEDRTVTIWDASTE